MSSTAHNLTADELEQRGWFVEEAEEIIEELETIVSNGFGPLSDNAVVQDVRRHFHTLKGSGRTVDAIKLSEVGWAIQDLLDQVTKGDIKLTDKRSLLITRVVSMLPALLRDFKDFRDDTYNVQPFITAAEKFKVVDDIEVPDLNDSSSDLTHSDESIAEPALNTEGLDTESSEEIIAAVNKLVSATQETLTDSNKLVESCNLAYRGVMGELKALKQKTRSSEEMEQLMSRAPQLSKDILDLKQKLGDVTSKQNKLAKLCTKQISEIKNLEEHRLQSQRAFEEIEEKLKDLNENMEIAIQTSEACVEASTKPNRLTRLNFLFSFSALLLAAVIAYHVA